MSKKEKTIDVRNKSKDEILKAYYAISKENSAQNIVYNMTGNAKIASRFYKLYRYEKERQKWEI